MAYYRCNANIGSEGGGLPIPEGKHLQYIAGVAPAPYTYGAAMYANNAESMSVSVPSNNKYIPGFMLFKGNDLIGKNIKFTGNSTNTNAYIGIAVLHPNEQYLLWYDNGYGHSVTGKSSWTYTGTPTAETDTFYLITFWGLSSSTGTGFTVQLVDK